MTRFIKIGEAAKVLGVSIQTLRRWEESRYLVPDRKTKGGTRYYSLDKLINKEILENELTVAYARVSSHDQKKTLKDKQRHLPPIAQSRAGILRLSKILGSRV
jgi:DNA-binding transcriptional MerR regulator